MESLRGTGYSLSAAISDLIDNSITAGATSTGPGQIPGCRYLTLVDAMRIGSRRPRDDEMRMTWNVSAWVSRPPRSRRPYL